MILKSLYRIGYVFFAALIGILLIASPILAITIGNPDDIDFGTGSTRLYNIFENVLETGDWLITAEGYVYYAADPSANYTASEAFIFELLNTAGNVTLASTSLKSYGDRPISIYLSNAQADNLSLVSESAYILRIMGNPLIFASPTGNSVNVTLGAPDYVDQNLGADGGVATANELRNYLIEMATNIQTHDRAFGIIGATDNYTVTVQGVRYLNLSGGDIFQEGIPGLSTMCPILFQAGLESMTSEAPEHTGTYALTLTPAQKWGATVANGLTMLGSYLGINQALAGSVILFCLVIAFAIYIYSKTESGVAVLLMVAATPFFGAYLGLMPMALAFIFVIIIVTLLGYFFFSRGAL